MSGLNVTTRVFGAVLLAALAGCAVPESEPRVSAASAQSAFAQLPGWRTARVADALPVFLKSCARLALAPPDQKLGGSGDVAARGGQAGKWSAVCAAARAVPPADEAAARAFLVKNFVLYPLTDAGRPAGLFTGYYEPEVEGSREKNRTYRVALIRKPADLVEQADGQPAPYYTRAEIDQGALRRQRLDLLYLKSPVDLFFLQIQGAGRVDLPNGHVVRVGYAGSNGQPYVPIGRMLSEQGEIAPDAVTAESIRDWLVAHPKQARATMELNPRYTFFREVPGLAPEDGPLGTLGVPLTPMQSVAVDAKNIPLGAPLWIDTTNVDGSKLQQLMLAQDLGAGVAGTVRADIFYGWGDTAEDQAGRMQAPGRAWLLLPAS